MKTDIDARDTARIAELETENSQLKKELEADRRTKVNPVQARGYALRFIPRGSFYSGDSRVGFERTHPGSDAVYQLIDLSLIELNIIIDEKYPARISLFEERPSCRA